LNHSTATQNDTTTPAAPESGTNYTNAGNWPTQAGVWAAALDEQTRMIELAAEGTGESPADMMDRAIGKIRRMSAHMTVKMVEGFAKDLAKERQLLRDRMRGDHVYIHEMVTTLRGKLADLHSNYTSDAGSSQSEERARGDRRLHEVYSILRELECEFVAPDDDADGAP
jgi:hypothetical protein